MIVRGVVLGIVWTLALPGLAGQPAYHRALSFEERVAAQEAIERVNYSHRVGATKPFELAVPKDVLEEKVRTYLKQSVALEKIWKNPITPTMLRRERERMARGTQMPERLRELYAALDDDPFLIEECLARATLADRLARNFLAYDERVQGAAHREALELRQRLSSGTLDVRRSHPRRTVRTFCRIGPSGEPSRREALELQLPSSEFDELVREVSAESGEPIVDERDAYRIRVPIEHGNDRLEIAEFRVPKRPWDDWWSVEKNDLDETAVEVVSEGDGSALIDLVEGCPEDDTWDPGSLSPAPEAYSNFTAVWTGSTMVVCGPFGTNVFAGYGQAAGQYDPETDTWEAASCGPRRRNHTAVWTGTEMIVWGGDNGSGFVPVGVRYNPVTGVSPISTSNAPEPRSEHTAVWTGTEMIVWGGWYNTGGRYDPSTDTWAATSTVNAPSARAGHTAIWTGTEMIVWGGGSNTGARYNPSTNTWTPTSIEAGVPAARGDHVAVWTGSRMVVWGGSGPTGGRYDPSTDSWQPVSSAGGVPGVRPALVAVWNGTSALVWNGQAAGRYDPADDTWTPMSSANAPPATAWHAAVWTGDRMLVWGGFRGGRYDPATDSWTPMAGSAGPNYGHAAVWTGNEMIVWGGAFTNNSGLYNAVTDSWRPLATTGAPLQSRGTAIWTGAEMIVWGGSIYSEFLNTGARYDPLTDTWVATSTGANVPSPRSGHTAVWTGSEMLVWGGNFGNGVLNTGGRYDPTDDSWSAISMGPNVPSARTHHAAAWTGNEMLVWGGTFPQFFNDGARYDPVNDSWAAISGEGAPDLEGRTVVWTGSALFVTGNATGSIGGLYHPSTDTWTPTEPNPGTGGSAQGRSAIWAGSRVVLWGGYPNSNGGARYDPVAHVWEPTRVDTAPFGRSEHSAVWTGTWMIVWGGWLSGPLSFGAGSRYAVNPDDDADGVTTCGGDCHDHSAVIHPGAAEVCNAVDDDCDAAVDEDASGVDSDDDAVHNACDNCRFAYNPSQLDHDGDLVGSACDNCIAVANAGQHDLDSDQRGNVCDNCPAEHNPFQDDVDADRWGDVCDNCLFDFNPPQTDFNNDGQGDLCDVNDGLIYLSSSHPDYIEWQDESGPTSFSVYEGDLAVLRSTGVYTQNPGSNPSADRTCGVVPNYIEDFEIPPVGAVKFALVTGMTANIEGSLGTNSAGANRPNVRPCP